MKNKFLLPLSAILFSAILFSCATGSSVKKSEAYPEFYGENPPASILIMPPINKTNNVDAKDYFYYTLPAALANYGYYVYPALLSMNTLQENSAYDAELFLEGNVTRFKKNFGADLLLFTTITEWQKHPVGGHVDVTVEYALRSTTTGEFVYRRTGTFDCDTSFKTGLSGGGILGLVGLLADTVGTAVKTAATDYTTVARCCNYLTLSDIPYGKYSPGFGKDGESMSGVNPIKTSAKVSGVSD